MEHLHITPVTLDDIANLQKISMVTFSETYAWANTEENMREYLRKYFAKERLTNEVKHDRTIWYFARSGEQVIGYLKLGTDKDISGNPPLPILQIERIYVLRAFQRKKVGQLLLDKAIEVANDQQAAYVWLGVWEKNLKAISFYRKNGFEIYDQHLFKLGNEEQTDLLMKLVVLPV